MDTIKSFQKFVRWKKSPGVPCVTLFSFSLDGGGEPFPHHHPFSAWELRIALDPMKVFSVSSPPPEFFHRFLLSVVCKEQASRTLTAHHVKTFVERNKVGE
jgi:hypothetical protein